jgi:hypothetical protein
METLEWAVQELLTHWYSRGGRIVDGGGPTFAQIGAAVDEHTNTDQKESVLTHPPRYEALQRAGPRTPNADLCFHGDFEPSANITGHGTRLLAV